MLLCLARYCLDEAPVAPRSPINTKQIRSQPLPPTTASFQKWGLDQTRRLERDPRFNGSRPPWAVVRITRWTPGGPPVSPSATRSTSWPTISRSAATPPGSITAPTVSAASSSASNRRRRRAAEQCDELAPPHAGHGLLAPRCASVIILASKDHQAGGLPHVQPAGKRVSRSLGQT